MPDNIKKHDMAIIESIIELIDYSLIKLREMTIFWISEVPS